MRRVSLPHEPTTRGLQAAAATLREAFELQPWTPLQAAVAPGASSAALQAVAVGLGAARENRRVRVLLTAASAAGDGPAAAGSPAAGARSPPPAAQTAGPPGGAAAEALPAHTVLFDVSLPKKPQVCLLAHH